MVVGGEGWMTEWSLGVRGALRALTRVRLALHAHLPLSSSSPNLVRCSCRPLHQCHKFSTNKKSHRTRKPTRWARWRSRARGRQLFLHRCPPRPSLISSLLPPHLSSPARYAVYCICRRRSTRPYSLMHRARSARRPSILRSSGPSTPQIM